MSLTDEGHYGPKQLNMLKTVWGEGFLSPGGTEEIDQILKGLNLKNKKVLDIGCGTGGAVFHMIEKYGAKDKAKFICTKPGEYKFEDKSFEAVFSKEAFLHIIDKKNLLKEINEILADNGILAVGDWMRNDDNEPSEQMKEYIAAEGLDMFMCSLEKYESLLKETGFKVLSLNDRNKWYLEKVKTEISDIRGPLYDDVVNLIGKEEADGALEIWEKLLGVVEKGEHRPGNFQAVKIST